VLNTDQPDRDMLTWLIHGARNLTGVSFAAMLLCFAGGVTLGLMAVMDVAGSTRSYCKPWTL
jgi:ABC-type dipeptide/oligopeptide/nickel transport system permease subunit